MSLTTLSLQARAGRNDIEIVVSSVQYKRRAPPRGGAIGGGLGRVCRLISRDQKHKSIWLDCNVERGLELRLITTRSSPSKRSKSIISIVLLVKGLAAPVSPRRDTPVSNPAVAAAAPITAAVPTFSSCHPLSPSTFSTCFPTATSAESLPVAALRRRTVRAISARPTGVLNVLRRAAAAPFFRYRAIGATDNQTKHASHVVRTCACSVAGWASPASGEATAHHSTIYTPLS